MTRVKQAVYIIQNKTEEISNYQDYIYIKGMLEMAERLDRISFYEKIRLDNEAFAKYQEISGRGY